MGKVMIMKNRRSFVGKNAILFEDFYSFVIFFQLSQKMETDEVPDGPTPLIVAYCPVCTMPYEYCEFGPSRDACKEGLREQTDLASLFSQLYGDGVEVEGAEKPKQKVKGPKAKTAKAIVIKQEQRGKRKNIITVSGLESYDIDLKKAAKLMANKFATGARYVGGL
jgi:translation initiation factor 1 (eIF-1/SUI1)